MRKGKSCACFLAKKGLKGRKGSQSAGGRGQALRLAARLPEAEQVVGPLAAEAASSLLSEIADNEERLHKYLDRYKQVLLLAIPCSPFLVALSL